MRFDSTFTAVTVGNENGHVITECTRTIYLWKLLFITAESLLKLLLIQVFLSSSSSTLMNSNFQFGAFGNHMCIFISNRNTCKCTFKPHLSGFRQLFYRRLAGQTVYPMATCKFLAFDPSSIARTVRRWYHQNSHTYHLGISSIKWHFTFFYIFTDGTVSFNAFKQYILLP